MNPTRGEKVKVKSGSFIVVIKNYIGRATLKLHSDNKFVSKDARELIKKMIQGRSQQRLHGQLCPQILQHTNRGGLLLIRETFIPFSIHLMKTCREAAAGRNGYKKHYSWISKGLETVQKDKSLLSQFPKVVLTKMGGLFDQPLCKVFYRQIAEYCLRLFTKYTNNKDFSKTSSSLLHMQFQCLIAYSAKTEDSGKPKMKKIGNEKKRSLSTMLGEFNRSASAFDRQQQHHSFNYQRQLLQPNRSILVGTR